MEACHDGKTVLCFFKVLIAEWFLEVLDSSGHQWRVTVCKHNGSLAIKEGCLKFPSEHGLEVGNFLVFGYVSYSQHFIVQIFGTSDCEIINFCSDIGKGKKIARTYPEETTPCLK